MIKPDEDRSVHLLEEINRNKKEKCGLRGCVLPHPYLTIVVLAENLLSDDILSGEFPTPPEVNETSKSQLSTLNTIINLGYFKFSLFVYCIEKN